MLSVTLKRLFSDQLTETSISLVSRDEFGESSQLQRSRDLAGGMYTRFALREMNVVRPFISTLPDYEPDPESEVRRCQMHEPEPRCQTEPFHQNL